MSSEAHILPLFDRVFEKGEQNRSVSVGAALRDRGIEDAYDKAVRIKSEYVESCLEAIRSFPKGARITSEDIRERAGEPPKDVERSVLAGILKAAKAQGLISITSESTPGETSIGA